MVPSSLHHFINERALSNEVVSFNDLFILYYLVHDEKIALGRFLQWCLWLISDSLVSVICVGGVVTKLAQFFRVDLHFLPSIKPMLLDESFIKNSKQFTFLNKKWVWKYDLGDNENVEALFKEIEDYQGEVKNKKKKLSHKKQEREIGVKAPLFKALKPLKMNLFGLDKYLIV